MLEFATIDGARSIMLEDKVGSLTPGKQADIVLLKTDVINTAPVLDPKATIVTFADTSNVDSVFVAGKAVKRDGAARRRRHEVGRAELEESRNHILVAGRAAARLVLGARRGASHSDADGEQEASSSSAGRAASAASSRSSTPTRDATS